MKKSFIKLVFFLVILIGVNFPLIGQHNTYAGYRVYLSDIKVLKTKGNTMNISFKPINTGRYPLSFGKKSIQQDELVVVLDPKYKSTDLNGHEQAISNSLNTQIFNIDAGKIGEVITMDISTKSKSVVSSKVSTDHQKTLNEGKSSSTSSNANESKLKDDSKPENPVKDTNFFDTKNCSDLVFENISIKKHTKNTLILSYTILNKGNKPANLEGQSRSNTTDNVGVRAYMSRSEKLPKGATVLGGDFVKNRSSKYKGMLQPNESHTSTIRLNAFNITKFTPFVTLELDAFGQVRECDETNNKISIKVK